MRHSLVKQAALFALMGVLVTGGGSASAAGHSGSSASSFRVRETVTSLTQVDVGAPGLSPGDEAIYRLRITTLSGDRLGVNNVVCTILTPASKAQAHCVGTAGFPHGTLEFGGVLALASPHATFAITGGTGSYRAARGQSRLRWLDFPADTTAIITTQLVG